MRSAVLSDSLPAPVPAPRFRDRLAARAVTQRLGSLRGACLRVTEAGRTQVHGDPAAALRAEIEIRDSRCWSAVALRGSIGAGEAWIQGWWHSDDLTQVVRILLRNREALSGLDRGLARLARPLQRAWHALRPNTRAGSRRNIAAHYDLGNDFFEQFLDETMTYSCGIFEREDATMAEASLAKIDRLCRKLGLRADDHLLEIGTGWGALAVRAAERHGCRVTTVTLSQQQHAAAQERVRAAGLEDRVEVRLQDYRDVEGRFDKLVSVEMIEAIGHQQFDTFFRTCSRLLKPDGLAAVQAITIDDQHYERAKRSVDFIKRYVFPGSCIPSVGALTASMSRAGDLRVVELEDITPHYVRTIRAWSRKLAANRERVLALGYQEDLLRLWEFYLAYCEGGFLERSIGDVQMVLARSGRRSGAAG